MRGAFFQGEDELCSIYAITAASLAGAKAMTATASAGYGYMQEGIGYAVAVEAPVVVLDVMRCRGENFATQADTHYAGLLGCGGRPRDDRARPVDGAGNVRLFGP